MQQHAKHLDIFVRTGIWFVEIAANYGINKPYTPEEIEHLHRDPDNLTAISKSIEDQVNALGGVFFAGSEAQIGAQKLFGDRMAEFIRDPRLLKGFTPKFGVGCRRITPGDAYMVRSPRRARNWPPSTGSKLTGGYVERDTGAQRRCPLHSRRRGHRGESPIVLFGCWHMLTTR